MVEHLTADIITSRDNKWLKMFRAGLRGTGPAGDEALAVEGRKLVEDALQSGLEAVALLVSESGERELEHILRAASESVTGIPRARVLRTTDKLFESVAGTETPQGVAALFRQLVWQFEDVLRGTSSADGAFTGTAPLLVVMTAVQDPGNVGTIVRSAQAFGATGAVTTRGSADPWSPKALRASAGSALWLPLLRGMAVPVLLAQLRVADVKVVAASSHVTAESGPESYAAVDLRESVAIFIGNEGAGLPPEVEHAADARISIPIADRVESLNAGIAASIVLYEAARQRRGTAEEHT
jgi:RNA methyltransferase, TrmH family